MTNLTEVVDSLENRISKLLHRYDKLKAEKQKQSARRTLESLSSEIASGETKELVVVLKADVQGSIEALRKLSNDGIVKPEIARKILDDNARALYGL